jgi:hypothetical protein
VSLDEVPIACHRFRPDSAQVADVDVGQLAERLGDRLQDKIDSLGDDRPHTTAALDDWFLELCDTARAAAPPAPGARHYLVPETGGGNARVRVASAPPAGRRHGLRMHGADVGLVLDRRLELEHIKFSGALRYHSAPVVTDEAATELALFLPLYVLASWED